MLPAPAALVMAAGGALGDAALDDGVALDAGTGAVVVGVGGEPAADAVLDAAVDAARGAD